MIEHQPHPVPIRIPICESIPTQLQQLLALTKKKDVEKFSRHLRITRGHLTRLKFNCAELGFSVEHRRDHFPAKGLAEVKDEWKRAFKSIAEQRIREFYLYERGNEWHLFYFTGDDAEIAGWSKPHWKFGPHFHYLSSVWSRQTAKEVRERLRQRDVQFDSLHIRFSRRFP